MISFPFIARHAARLNTPKGEVVPPTGPDIYDDAKYRSLLLDPVYMAYVITAMISWIIMGFNEPTLEPSIVEVPAYVTLFCFYETSSGEHNTAPPCCSA